MTKKRIIMLFAALLIMVTIIFAMAVTINAYTSPSRNKYQDTKDKYNTINFKSNVQTNVCSESTPHFSGSAMAGLRYDEIDGVTPKYKNLHLSITLTIRNSKTGYLVGWEDDIAINKHLPTEQIIIDESKQYTKVTGSYTATYRVDGVDKDTVAYIPDIVINSTDK